jgi:carbamate kinase
MKIHVAIVSEQILANLIPAPMERPDKVLPAASPEMTKRKLDKRLAHLLEQDGIAVEQHGNAPEVGMRQIDEYASKLRETRQQWMKPVR